MGLNENFLIRFYLQKVLATISEINHDILEIISDI